MGGGVGTGHPPSVCRVGGGNTGRTLTPRSCLAGAPGLVRPLCTALTLPVGHWWPTSDSPASRLAGMTDLASELDEALAVPPDRTAAAFFDVDNTVDARREHLAPGPRALAPQLLHRPRRRARWPGNSCSFAALGESLDHIEKIREQALGFIAGHSVAEIGAIGEEIYDEAMHDKIWPGTQALTQHAPRRGPGGLARHRDARWRSPQVIADRLGLTGALGTVAESRRRRSTPAGWSGSRCTVPAKATRSRRWPPTRGFDLARAGLLGLGQRHPDALARRAPLRDQPRRRPARPRPGQRLDDPGLPDRAPGRQGRGRRPSGATALAGALAAAAARRRVPLRRRPERQPGRRPGDNRDGGRASRRATTPHTVRLRGGARRRVGCGAGLPGMALTKPENSGKLSRSGGPHPDPCTSQRREPTRGAPPCPARSDGR